MTSYSLFQTLPTPLILVILSYVSDAETICSFEAVCQDFRAVILQNHDFIWERLHQQRWTIVPSSSSSSSSNMNLTKAEYARRHQLDASAIKCIGRLQQQESSSLSSSSITTNHRRVMHNAVMDILASGKYVLDACWNIWRSAKNDEELLVAHDVVHLLHCYTVCEDLVGLLGRIRNSSSSTTAQEAPTAAAPLTAISSDAYLEECAILTSKIFCELDKEDIMGGDTKSQWIRNEFDRIANMVREQYANEGFDAPHEMNITQKIYAVHKVMFGDEFLVFSGNTENYYDVDNSLLHMTLKRRNKAAIPMTLAIIYKCVCRRLGIHVDIIGLPGHIVVHVPELGRYVDVFHGGMFLSQQDCALIVRMYGFAMEDSYLEPLSTQLVVYRVLKNIENCLERENQLGRRNVIRRAYSPTLKTLSSGENNDAKLETCRRLLGRTWVTEHVERRLHGPQNLP